MLEAWVSGLDAEFVGTGVRASIVRSDGAVPPDDACRLISATICAPDAMHLRLVDVIPSHPRQRSGNYRRKRPLSPRGAARTSTDC